MYSGIIYFASQIFGDIFVVGKLYLPMLIASGIIFLTFIFISLKLTYHRIIVSAISIKEKRIFLKDRVIDRNNLSSFSDYKYKGKSYIKFDLENGKQISFYSRNVNFNEFIKAFQEYNLYNQQLDKPGPILNDDITSDLYDRILFLIREHEDVENEITNYLDEAIISEQDITFNDAQSAISIVALLLSLKAPDWAKYNLPNLPKFTLSKEKIIYEKAFNVIKLIKETKNEWLEITEETGVSYYQDEIEQMYILTEKITKNLDVSNYIYPKELIFNRLLDISKGYRYNDRDSNDFTKHIEKIKEKYMEKDYVKMNIEIEKALDNLLLNSFNNEIAVDLIRLKDLKEI